jgi:NTE family protein
LNAGSLEAGLQDERFGALQLGSLPLFEKLAPDALRAVADCLEVLWLPAGQNLFQEGDEPDALYVLAAGALAVLLRTPDVPETEPHAWRWLGRVNAGETVGEMALLSGKKRNATVRALRDSEVLRFKRSDFEALMSTHAPAMLHVGRLAFQRLEAIRGQDAHRPRTGKAFALVPLTAGVDMQEFALELVDSLARFGSVALLSEAQFAHLGSSDFHRMEQQHTYLVYLATHGHGSWTELCKRQSDDVLFVASTQTQAELALATSALDPLKTMRLVLRHRAEVALGSAQRWLQHFPNARIHHVRSLADIDRVARFLTANATGLVLGGGGARGFAHLGVIRALREAGLQIDTVAGTSIGAIVAAGVAMEWSDEELYFRYHRSFVQSNPLSDYTLPFVALVAGRRASARLREEYQQTMIEDLALPFFCISSNLSRGDVQEHRRGLLWRALRASIAIPGILPPVFSGGEVLVDGGVINNLPVEIMRRDLHGRLIGVDISGDYAIAAGVEEFDLPPLWRMSLDWFGGKRPRPTILQILLRSGMVNSASKAEQNRRSSDLLIKPPVEQVELMDWKAFDRVIDIGYRHTLQLLERGQLNLVTKGN